MSCERLRHDVIFRYTRNNTSVELGAQVNIETGETTYYLEVKGEDKSYTLLMDDDLETLLESVDVKGVTYVRTRWGEVRRVVIQLNGLSARVQETTLSGVERENALKLIEKIADELRSRASIEHASRPG